jgi:hypothetical protein
MLAEARRLLRAATSLGARPRRSSLPLTFVDARAVVRRLTLRTARDPPGDAAEGWRTSKRVNTSGGIAPTRSCTEGDEAFVPYTTDYYFYEAE